MESYIIYNYILYLPHICLKSHIVPNCVQNKYFISKHIHSYISLISELGNIRDY